MELIIGLFGLIFLLFKFGGEKSEHKKTKIYMTNWQLNRETFQAMVYDKEYELKVERMILDTPGDAVRLAQSIYPELEYHTFFNPPGKNWKMGQNPHGDFCYALLKYTIMASKGKAPMFYVPKDLKYNPKAVRSSIPSIYSALEEHNFRGGKLQYKYEAYIRWYEKTMQENGVPGIMVSIKHPENDKYQQLYHPVSDVNIPVEETVTWNSLLNPSAKPY